jgi:hypothetical protein
LLRAWAIRDVPESADADATQPQPHTGLLELRFDLEDKRRRVTYWITPERRVVLPTTFHQQRDNERAEIDQARAAMERCRAEQHTADE